MSVEPSLSQARPDVGLIRRWLTALGLLATAEQVVGRGDEASASLALIAADAAAEVVLGIIGQWAPPGSRTKHGAPTFHDLILDAAAALDNAGGMPPGLRSHLEAAHGARTQLVHHGAPATAAHAQGACRAARQLLDLLPNVAAAFSAMPAGAGIVAGIVSLLDAPELTAQLLAGEEALPAGDAVAAADAAARAHAQLLLRLEPRLGGDLPDVFWMTERDALGHRLEAYLKALGKTVGRLQGWALASAVGLPPATYRRFRLIAGEHTGLLGGDDSVWRSAPPSIDDARWAVVAVAEMAFRLWELGSLAEGTDAQVHNRRWDRGDI